ncbi:MAG: hypothetical protein LN364_01195 [Candidatus Thermoplasmatota archaeon]|nr:hypothetical protein [Candidatus Thermoplasmatota archaeon]
MDNEYLIKYAELVWNGHLHTEKLSHEIFYVLTALVIGSWTVSSHLNLDIIVRLLLIIFAMILTLAGLLITYRLQQSVQDIHVKMNLIRKKLGLDEPENDGKAIFEEWKKYEIAEIKDLDLIPRKGLKADNSFYSWWGIYKWLYLVMFVISVCMVVSYLASFS